MNWVLRVQRSPLTPAQVRAQGWWGLTHKGVSLVLRFCILWSAVGGGAAAGVEGAEGGVETIHKCVQVWHPGRKPPTCTAAALAAGLLLVQM